jgi:autotransporter-associated beta strand protein
LGSATGTAKIIFELGTNAVDTLAVTGNASVVGATQFTISPLASDTSLTNGNYTLISAGGGLNSSSFSLAAPALTINGALYDLSLTASTSTAEVLTVKQDPSSVAAAYWSGAQNSLWNYTTGTSNTSGGTNWQTTQSSGTDTGYIPSSITNVIFTSNSGASSNLATTLGANFSINSLSFDGIASGPISISGNTLTISATGFGGNAAGNGINLSSGSTAVTINSNIVLGSAQTWTNASPNPLNIGGNLNAASYGLTLAGSGPFNLSGPISNASALVLTGSGSVAIGSNLSGGTPITVSGGGTLTLSGSNTFTGGVNTSGGGLILNNASALGTGPLIVTGALSLDNTSGTPITLSTNTSITLGGNLNFVGTNNLNLGTGTLTLAGSRTINVSAGTLTVPDIVTDGGNYSTLTTGGAGTLNFTGPVNGTTYIAATGPGTVNFTANNNYSGFTTVTGGTVNISGINNNSSYGSVTGGTLNFIGASSSTATATWTVGGTAGASLNLNSTGAFTFFTSSSPGGGFSIGASGSNTYGAVTQTNGTVTFNDYGAGSYVFIGSSSGSYGSYLMTGGTLTAGVNQSTGMVVGYGSGLGSFVQTGGTLNLSRVFYIGDGNTTGATAQGVATFTGGTFTTTIPASFGVANSGIQFGSTSGGNGDGGTFNLGTLAGGNAVVTNSVISQGTIGNGGGMKFFLGNSNSTATVNLDAGTLSLAAGIASGTSALFNNDIFINLNGGTLQATGSFNLLDSSLASTTVTVFKGGAIFDVTGSNIATIATNLNAASGNGVFGQNSTGAISVANGSGGTGYIGAPLVTVGGGSGSGAQAIANVSNGTVTGIILTDPGQGYSVGDTLSFSFAGGGATSPANYSYTLTAADVQTVAGGGLTKTDTGTLVLSATDTYTGPTLVKNGTLVLSGAGALPAGSNLSIGTATTPATVMVALNQSGSPITVITAGSVSLSGATNAWTGKLDLNNGVAIIHSGSVAQMMNQISEGYAAGTWQGTGGITSSMAAADTTHLTALGVMINDTGANSGNSSGTALVTSMDGSPTSDGDILVKYTYFGDANLSGSVDGSDYSLIDNGYLNHLTGWYNGDFNYDGVVNGSDYTLIDNAYNTQGASLAASIAGASAIATAQIATGDSSVPEPSTIGVIGLGLTGLLSRRASRRRRTVLEN